MYLKKNTIDEFTLMLSNKIYPSLNIKIIDKDLLEVLHSYLKAKPLTVIQKLNLRKFNGSKNQSHYLDKVCQIINDFTVLKVKIKDKLYMNDHFYSSLFKATSNIKSIEMIQPRGNLKFDRHMRFPTSLRHLSISGLSISKHQRLFKMLTFKLSSLTIKSPLEISADLFTFLMSSGKVERLLIDNACYKKLGEIEFEIDKDKNKVLEVHFINSILVRSASQYIVLTKLCQSVPKVTLSKDSQVEFGYRSNVEIELVKDQITFLCTHFSRICLIGDDNTKERYAFDPEVKSMLKSLDIAQNEFLYERVEYLNPSFIETLGQDIRKLSFKVFSISNSQSMKALCSLTKLERLKIQVITHSKIVEDFLYYGNFNLKSFKAGAIVCQLTSTNSIINILHLKHDKTLEVIKLNDIQYDMHVHPSTQIDLYSYFVKFTNLKKLFISVFASSDSVELFSQYCLTKMPNLEHVGLVYQWMSQITGKSEIQFTMDYIMNALAMSCYNLKTIEFNIGKIVINRMFGKLAKRKRQLTVRIKSNLKIENRDETFEKYKLCQFHEIEM